MVATLRSAVYQPSRCTGSSACAPPRAASSKRRPTRAPVGRQREVQACDTSVTLDSAGGAGVTLSSHYAFSRRTNQTQEAQIHSHDGPIRHRKCRHILMTDQSDTGNARGGGTRGGGLCFRHRKR
eukprot:7107811-Pyramimonas_sp.AAC.1